MKKGKVFKTKKEHDAKYLKDQLARALADYDNFQKRVERERKQFEVFASAKIAFRILPVFDMLEDVQKHLGDSGIALTLEEFKKVLGEEGIEKINTEPGMKFDEKLHEAVEVISTKDKKKQGVIVEEVLSGWQMNDEIVIRPAKVKVYKK